MAHLAIPNQDLNTLSLSPSPNTTHPILLAYHKVFLLLCSFLTLFPDFADPNIALGDAEHMAEQTAAMSSGSNMFEVSIAVELS